MVAPTEWMKVKSQALSDTSLNLWESTAGCEESCGFLYEPLATAYRVSSLPGFVDLEQPAVLVMSEKKPVHLQRGEIIGTLSTVLALPIPELTGEVSIAVDSDSAFADRVTYAIPDHPTLAEKKPFSTSCGIGTTSSVSPTKILDN